MTPEVEAKIVHAISLGMYPDRAAEMHGIAKSTMRSHRARHPEFASMIKEAEAKAESGFISSILLHSEKQWTACAWLLERRFPKRWAKRDIEQAQSAAQNAMQLVATLNALSTSMASTVPNPDGSSERKRSDGSGEA